MGIPADIGADIGAQLAQWDGAATAVLVAVHDRLSGQPGYGANLLRLLPAHDRGATWLLKHAAEARQISADEAAAALACLPDVADWQARLHLHQLADLCPPDAQAPDDMDILWAEAIKDTGAGRKILQAWALNSLSIAAQRDPARRADALRHLRDAPRTGAIAARVRHALTHLT